MQFLTNLNATDCCQTTTNKKLIYFPTNSCKLQKQLGCSKIRSLKSKLLGKIHALLQDVLIPQNNSLLELIYFLNKVKSLGI